MQNPNPSKPGRRKRARLPWYALALAVAAVVTIGDQKGVRAFTSRFVSPTGDDTSGANDCSSPGQPCKTIQNAVNHSGSGDLIELAPGTYRENVTVNQSVTIQGDAFNPSVVDGGGIGSVFIIQRLDLSSAPLTATLSMMTITNGNAKADLEEFGGGIQNLGTLTVVQSTISGNKGTAGTSIAAVGGGISNGSTLTVINSTISGNQIVGIGDGGGIFNGSASTATLVNTTINGNTAVQGGGVHNLPTGTLNFTNTIVSGSTAGGDCVSGPIGTHSHNLVQDGSCSPAVSGNPKLGPLQNNGGPTFIHALLDGSPAIDAGDDSVVDPMGKYMLTTDQRGPGFPRKSFLHVDIGAFEAQPFDTCLKDNSTGNLLQWNTTTGAYKFTRCSDGFMLTGTGKVGLTNGMRTLTDSQPDRRVSAGFSTATLTGSATIYLMVAQGVWQTFRVNASNPSAVCSC
jgi:hypothetical protein